MSFSALRRRNRGAYSSPFSGVGVEFYPLNVRPDQAGLVLHEAGYLPRNDWWNFPNVLSPFWRLYHNLDRGHHVTFGRRRYELAPNRLMLIPERRLFHCHGHTPVRTFWLAFSVARRLAGEEPGPLLLAPSALERGLLGELRRDLDPRAPGPRERVLHRSLALLHLLLARPELRWREGTTGAGVAAARRRLEEDFAQALPVPELATAAGMSVRAFASAFQREVGVSPGRYRTQVRVREAASRLANSRETLEAIAGQTGFPNRDYLTRVFHRVTGETPAAFRRRQQDAG